jgi:hypothetical protein
MRGQVSTELLIIVCIVLLIFIPMLVLVYVKSGEANDKISSYQAELSVARLAYLADSVGSLGSNASVQTDIYIPSGVTTITTSTVGRGGEVDFRINTPAGQSEIVEIVEYPIKNPGTYDVSTGWARFDISSSYENGQASVLISKE